MKPSPFFAQLFTGLVAFLIFTGCDKPDWNWDLAWWQPPRRVVQPTKSNAAKSTSTQPAPPKQPIPETREEQAAQVSEPRAVAARNETRPFYQLYLTSSEKAPGEPRGEHRIQLHTAPARACAAVLEMLTIPLGRSGNDEECYLLFEDRGEFDIAVDIAAMLDVPAVQKPTTAQNPEGAFNIGLGQFYAVLQRGVVVDRALIDATEKRLAEALLSSELDSPKRWAAGVLACRLMSEYRYDYAAARGYASQAEQLAAPDSFEQLVAIYWRADTWVQEGKPSNAAPLYQKIVETYGPRVMNSQIVRQAKAGVKEKRRKS